MKIRQIGSNQMEIGTNDKLILISYSTPVATFIFGKGHFRTSRRFGISGVTTQRHISMWLSQYGRTLADVEEKPQSFFNNLLE